MYTPTQQITGEDQLVIPVGPILNKKITDDEFYDFCIKFSIQNPGYGIERSAKGDLIIMPPTGGETGKRNFNLIRIFGNWVVEANNGVGFDSSTEFKLPNGAFRSPDVAWVKRERWEKLTNKEREKFPPLCPDFVIELRSMTDRLAILKSKMEEYVDNGAQLGWLIDPYEKKVWVYKPNSPVTCLDNPETINGDPELPGFILPLDQIWNVQ